MEQLLVDYYVATIGRVYDIAKTNPGRRTALASANPTVASAVPTRPGADASGRPLPVRPHGNLSPRPFEPAGAPLHVRLADKI